MSRGLGLQIKIQSGKEQCVLAGNVRTLDTTPCQHAIDVQDGYVLLSRVCSDMLLASVVITWLFSMPRRPDQTGPFWLHTQLVALARSVHSLAVSPRDKSPEGPQGELCDLVRSARRPTPKQQHHSRLLSCSCCRSRSRSFSRHARIGHGLHLFFRPITTRRRTLLRALPDTDSVFRLAPGHQPLTSAKPATLDRSPLRL